jgi:cobalamin biosynthesis Mg chelatase CobN
MRRTAVRNLERAGVSRSVAMKLTGHKTEAVYRRYAIADSTALAEGVEKLARLHEAEPHERRVVLPLNQASNGTNTAQSGHGRVAQG